MSLNMVYSPVVTSALNTREQPQGDPYQVFYMGQPQQTAVYAPQAGGMFFQSATRVSGSYYGTAYTYTGMYQQATGFSQASLHSA